MENDEEKATDFADYYGSIKKGENKESAESW